MIRALSLTLSLATLLVVAGCKTHTESTTETEPAKVAEETPAEAAPEPKAREREQPSRPRSGRHAGDTASPTDNYKLAAPDIEAGMSHEGPGLTIMIDGSSAQAYNQSMEMIASETSQSQYDALTAAISKLRMMTLQAKTEEAFYQTLDGMTGEEIIAEVRRRENRPG